MRCLVTGGAGFIGSNFILQWLEKMRGAIHEILGARPDIIASPGTYDQKHFARIAGVEDCVAYGPGILELAHQPDEYCDIDDLVNATKVMALTTLDLCGTV